MALCVVFFFFNISAVSWGNCIGIYYSESEIVESFCNDIRMHPSRCDEKKLNEFVEFYRKKSEKYAFNFENILRRVIYDLDSHITLYENIINGRIKCAAPGWNSILAGAFGGLAILCGEVILHAESKESIDNKICALGGQVLGCSAWVPWNISKESRRKIQSLLNARSFPYIQFSGYTLLSCTLALCFASEDITELLNHKYASFYYDKYQFIKSYLINTKIDADNL